METKIITIGFTGEEVEYMQSALLTQVQTFEAVGPALSRPAWSALSKLMGVTDARAMLLRPTREDSAQAVTDRPDTGWIVERSGDGSARSAGRRLLGLDLCIEPEIDSDDLWRLAIERVDHDRIVAVLRGAAVEDTFEVAEIFANRVAGSGVRRTPRPH